jgi:acyl carrier protein
MNSDIRNAIREYLTKEFGQDRPDFTLSDDTNLLQAQIIDSLGIFMLTAFLEERYGITIDPDEVLIEHFETIVDVSRFVESKLEPIAQS